MKYDYNDFVSKILSSFHRYTITDPYPDHTAYQTAKSGLSGIRKLFGWTDIPPPKPISIHQAYQDGFNFAKELVKLEAKNLPEFTKNKYISGEIACYAIRHPGKEENPTYCAGRDPEELKGKWYEGFNPVCAVVRLDLGTTYDTLPKLEDSLSQSADAKDDLA